MLRTELPKSFDVEANGPADPLEGLSRSRAVRLGAAVVCGIGLAVSVLALVRAGQGWSDPRQPDREPQVVGTLAPSPPPIPASPAPRPAPEAAAPPPTETAIGPAAPEPAPNPVVAARPPAPGPESVADVPEPAVPAPDPASIASLPDAATTPPVQTGLPAAPTTSLVTGAAPPVEPAIPAPAKAPSPVETSAAPPPRERPAATRRRVAQDRPPAEAMRPIAVPGGSGAGVRAYSLSADAGRVGPDGVRRIVVRLP